MNTKILLAALAVVTFSSCTTAYKNTQTPDDVYYSPARVVDEARNDNRQDPNNQYNTTSQDNALRMQIYDYRWRNLDYEYGYSYNYSPYNYSYGGYINYGYYYNPYYCNMPLYYPTLSVHVAAPINTTPRMVNLNTYKNYTTAVTTNPKTGVSTTTYTPRQYNNTNTSGSRVGNVIRQVFTPNNNNNSYNNNYPSTQPANNNTRSYTPAPSSNSGSSSTPSSGGGGGSVARPGRGG